jgi:drug/metabolite transporter (DMT)-like permease
MNINEWSVILYLTFTGSSLGYFIWFHVMNRVKAAVTSSLMFAEPPITVLFATVFLGEKIRLFTVTGHLIIFAGAYIVTRRWAMVTCFQRKQKSSSD